jgi:hypothetical protein
MSQPSDTTRKGTHEPKKNTKAGDIKKTTTQYMYGENGKKYPISTPTTSGDKSKPYSGKLYVKEVKPAPRYRSK